MKKALLIGLGAAGLGVLMCAGLVSFWLFYELPALDATLSLPPEVALGSSVDMVVTATNPHQEPVTLDSIDVGDTFLAGFEVVAVDPEPIDTMGIFGMHSWQFSRIVPAGGSIAVRFELRAIQEGRFSGDVDVCNPNQDFTTVLAEVEVKANPAYTAVESGGD